MNINNKVLTDLEIYNKIIPKIDFTITSFGTNKLKSLLKTYFYDNELIHRRNVIRGVLSGPKSMRSKIKKLKELHNLEGSLEWLTKDLDETEYKDLYFSNDYFNIKELLSLSNFLKVYSPAFIIIVYLIIYMILWYMKIPISVKDYLTGIYRSYQMMITGLLYLIMSNPNLISLLSNLLSTLYVFYQIYVSYSSIETSVAHYKKCTSFKNNFQDLRKFVLITNNILEKDKNIVLIYNPHERQRLINSITYLSQKLSPGNISSLGSVLLLKKAYTELKPDFDVLADYVGLVDSYINIARLIGRGGFAFPEYDFASDLPYIDCDKLWSLYIDNRSEQITNDCQMGLDDPNTMILTGPNTSGKSTYIRNIMLTILLSQTIGIAPCAKIKFTPFTNLFTYLDIPNIARNRESLFEAEVHRCLEFCKIIEQIPPNQFSFTIMDELFTGTNPEEGIACSYAVAEYLGQFDNSIMIITTHFNKLTQLENVYPAKFMNRKFYVHKLPDGSFVRPYKIEEGISDQNIAIELLRNKGYSSVIIDRAIKIKETLDK